MKGPNAGPMSVPLRNHPRAVARSVWRRMSTCVNLQYYGTYRFIDIANTTRANDQESSPLKCSQDTEDKVGRQIRCQGSADGEDKE
jgi:hypothetical protein